MKDNLGELIAKTRTDKKLTKKELADKLGVKTATITKWEKNIGKPSFSYLLLISKELDLDFDEIILGHEIDKKNRKKSNEELIRVVKKNIKYKNFFNVFAGIFVCLCLCFLEVVLYKFNLQGKPANYIFLIIMFMIYFVAVSAAVEKANLLEEKNKYREYALLLLCGFVVSIMGFAFVILN